MLGPYLWFSLSSLLDYCVLGFVSVLGLGAYLSLFRLDHGLGPFGCIRLNSSINTRVNIHYVLLIHLYLSEFSLNAIKTVLHIHNLFLINS